MQMQTIPQKSELLPTAAFDLRLVHGDELDVAFHSVISPELNKYACKHARVIDVGHVLLRLQEGDMQCGLFTQDGDILGVVLYHEVEDLFTPSRGIHIDFVHIVPHRGVFEEAWRIMDELAEHFNYDFITAQTIRPGFNRRHAPGWAETDRLWGKQYERRFKNT